jgi:hypothetical protein
VTLALAFLLEALDDPNRPSFYFMDRACEGRVLFERLGPKRFAVTCYLLNEAIEAYREDWRVVLVLSLDPFSIIDIQTPDGSGAADPEARCAASYGIIVAMLALEAGTIDAYH